LVNLKGRKEGTQPNFPKKLRRKGSLFKKGRKKKFKLSEEKKPK